MAKTNSARVWVNSIARLLDVRGALGELPRESESEAMLKDWQQVGEDLRSAMRETSEELPQNTRPLIDEELVTAS